MDDDRRMDPQHNGGRGTSRPTTTDPMVAPDHDPADAPAGNAEDTTVAGRRYEPL